MTTPPPTPAGLLASLVPDRLLPTEITSLIAFDPAVLEAYGLERAAAAAKAASSLFRLMWVSISSGIVVFLFCFFFIVLPISFFFGVVAKGEVQLREVKDQVYFRIVDALPPMPSLPALPFSASAISVRDAHPNTASAPDCETSQCDAAAEAEKET